MIVAEFPTALQGEDLGKFEAYLNKNLFSFRKRKSGGIVYFTVTVDEPVHLIWIGCNLTVIVAGLKLPITK